MTTLGTSYDPYSPFTVAGNYNFRVKYEGFTSNFFNFNVVEEQIYVSSLSVDGPEEIGIERPQQLTLTVNPSNHTQQIFFESTNESVATITRITNTTYEIVGHQKGGTVITFSANDTATTQKIIYYSLNVADNYVSSITASGPSILGMQSTIQVQLQILPADYTAEVTCTSQNESVATVEKVNNELFNVRGVGAGEVDLIFSAPSSKTTTIEKPYHVKVQNIEKTKIQQTYTDFNNHNYYVSNGIPSTGDVKLLVIPVWFSDSSSYIDSDYKDSLLEDINTAFFGTEEETGWHSVSSFYKEESKEKLRLTGTVSDWYSPGHDASYYSDDSGYVTPTLAVLGTNWYFNNHSDARTNYDSDHDGFLDGVIFIYGAPNHVTLQIGTGDNLWAYVTRISLPTSNVSNPNINTFMWASYDFMFNSTVSEDHTGHAYGYGDTSHCICDTHTYIHETGHMLGLDDYYDYGNQTTFAGRYSMQDYNVCGHDGFSLMALGWADPYIPTSSCVITLNDFQSSHELILLTPQWNEYDSPFDEYLLLELYSPTGLNKQDVIYPYGSRGQAPNAVGIRLWHVDATLYKNSTSKFTTNVFDDKIDTAFNNTTKTTAEGGRDCMAKPVSTYQLYSLLRLVRNNVLEDYMPNRNSGKFKGSDLFLADSTFSMSSYQSQFIKGEKLDLNNKSLGWQFEVDSITDYGTGQYSAKIILTRTGS